MGSRIHKIITLKLQMPPPNIFGAGALSFAAIVWGSLHPASYFPAALYSFTFGIVRTSGDLGFFSNLEFVAIALGVGMVRWAIFRSRVPTAVKLSTINFAFLKANAPLLLMLPIWIATLPPTSNRDWFAPDGGADSGMVDALILLPLLIASAFVTVPAVWWLSRSQLKALALRIVEPPAE